MGGQSPNTTMTTAMNSSTMSTTAPPGNTTLMVSNNMMGSTGSAGQGAMSPHKSSNKSLGEAPFGSSEIKEEIKIWATTGSQLGKHALEKLENVERRVRIIEKGVERTTDALARGSREELQNILMAAQSAARASAPPADAAESEPTDVDP